MLNNALRQRSYYRKKLNKFTGKELDAETGLYYYGARYLDPKTSRWLSGDPAMGEYLPIAPVNDEAKKRNQNLPGQGGVFNYVNLHAYHYAGNNPVKYVDPDGRSPGWPEWSPQAKVAYSDLLDDLAQKVFNIDATSFGFDGGTMRLWKGDYGDARNYSQRIASLAGVELPSFFQNILNKIGGSGGEIGFYDKNGKMITGKQLEADYGLLSTTMRVSERGSHNLIADAKGRTGWANGYNALKNTKPGDMYLVGILRFSTHAKAEAFMAQLQKAKEQGENYPHNNGNILDISLGGRGRRSIIIKWGLDE